MLESPKVYVWQAVGHETDQLQMIRIQTICYLTKPSLHSLKASWYLGTGKLEGKTADHYIRH